MRIPIVMLCLLGVAPCLAAEPLAGVLACRAIADSTARLACFDRETSVLAASASAAGNDAAAALPAATSASANTANAAAVSGAAAAPPAVSAPPLDPKQSFGLSGSAIAEHEEASGARPAKLAKIEARVVGLSLTGNGRTVFTLDNSQMWRQLESDGDMLARLGDTATISRGLLGSYWLQLKTGRGCKVTRIR